MKRSGLAWWIVAGALLLASGTAQAEDFQAEAQTLGSQKNWSALAALCQRWTATAPQNQMAWVMLGDAYGEAGQLPPMEQAFAHAAALAPTDPRPWELAGAYHAKKDDFAGAVPFLQKAVKAAPDDAKSWLGLATQWDNFATQRQFKQGAAPSGALVDIDTQKDFRAAAEAYQRALELHAAAPGFLGRQIANSYLNANDYSRAIQLYIADMQQNGDDSYALNGLALASHDLQTSCTRITSTPTGPTTVTVTKTWICDHATADLVQRGLNFVARGTGSGH